MQASDLKPPTHPDLNVQANGMEKMVGLGYSRRLIEGNHYVLR